MLSKSSLTWDWCDADPKRDLGVLVPALLRDEHAVRLLVANRTEAVYCRYQDRVHHSVARGCMGRERGSDVPVCVIG